LNIIFPIAFAFICLHFAVGTVLALAAILSTGSKASSDD
jgi:hypothetical protein